MSHSENNEHLHSVPLQIRAVLPCHPLTIGELLSLDSGSLIRTARAAGDNVDVRVSDRWIAQAELIVVDNALAIRISEFTENT